MFSKKHILLTLVVAGLFFQSCDSLRTIKLTYRFLHSKLALPTKMIKVENGQDYECEYSADIPVYVIYYSPEECSECALNHMIANKPYFDFSRRQGNFETIVVVAPKREIYSEVISLAKQLAFPNPIYIDFDHYLEKQSVIPQDDRFHSFLLDTEGDVCYIGRPLSSQSSQRQFIKCLSEIKAKEI